MKILWKVLTDVETKEGEGYFAAGSNCLRTELASGHVKAQDAAIELSIDKDEKIFMNGYQTWTDCPEYAPDQRQRGLNWLPKFGVDRFSLDRYSDYHFVEYPFKKGLFHGFSYCYFRKGDTYRLFGSLNEENGYTIFRYDANQKRLTLHKDNEGLLVGGQMELFRFYYAEGTEKEVFDGWFEALNIRPITDQKLCGYSSWYNRYQNIDEANMRKDLEGCKEIFSEGDLFQIDDGWEPFVGDWLTTDPVKFPNGLKQLVEDIHGSGFKAGLWLAPFVAEEKSELYQKHQDWFLKVNGGNWKCGCNWSGFYSLDIDNPEVISYLKEAFHRVFDEWGFDLVKLDFLYGAAPFGNEKETRAGRMYRAMRFLRELCGEKAILGCGVPVMPAFGLVEYCRISCDVSLDWNDVPYMRLIHRERTSTRNAIHNIISRRQLNRRAYLSDPDVFFLRSENTKLTTEQKDDLVTLDALFGDVFLTSDDPGNYTEEMKQKYREFRKLLKAEKADISLEGGVNVRYEINGEKHEQTLFKGSKL
ncbi:MAG: alpha-galactosidase [Erysipelotrichaceae bacterium]|nr:alpha-galactosidase [Erysipelotrichaceae bacterium]